MVKSWRFALVLLLLGAAACHPTIDTSSNVRLVTSVAHVRYSLDKAQRSKFDEALLAVAFRDVHDKGIFDLVRHPDSILPDARAHIEGKTGEQVIAQANKLKAARD